MPDLLYFSYGSNMLLERLRQPDRAPSARLIGTATISARRLSFDKVGSDGSGKCDAAPTTEHRSLVWGGVFAIAAADRITLDRTEGLGVGYRLVHQSAELDNGNVLPVFFYEAITTEPGLRPFDWYLRIVRAGACELGLPANYVRQLDRLQAIPDPDPRRAAAHLTALRDRGETRPGLRDP